MRCPICESTDRWKNVDQYRLKAEGMSLCQQCGFVSYPAKYKTKDEIKEYYKTSYRSVPGANNIITGERKLHYHAHFLAETLDQWKAEGREEIVVSDVGAAIGMVLNWLRGHFSKGTYKGVELTTGFVRNAYHMFGIELDDDFDDSIKYDLITSYKTLEHILDPDWELKRYIEALKPDGVLNFSVPIWFEELSNFGVQGFDVESYYHPDHINTWTKKHVEGLIKFSGGKVVRENHTMYGDTYLIMKDEKPAGSYPRQVMYEDADEIEKKLAKIAEVNEAYQTADYQTAVNKWPNFPVAWRAFYEANRRQLHEVGIEGIEQKFILPMLQSCPSSPDVQKTAADVYMRYEKYKDALRHLKQANEMQPNGTEVLAAIGQCYRELAKRCKVVKDKVKFYSQAKDTMQAMRSVSSGAFTEATNWLMFDNANIPTPKEVK